MLPVEVLVPGGNSRSTCKDCGIYTGPSLLEPYKSHNNIYIYKAAYNNMMNHVIIFLVRVSFSFLLACCQGSKPVLESFSDIQCVFLEDSRRHCIFL